MSNSRKFWVKVCQSGAVILTGVSWLSGCEKSGNPGGDEVSEGDECRSSSGHEGIVVHGHGECLIDDAFCEVLAGDLYCTGSVRSKCRKGSDGESRCVPPNGTGGQGGEGSGGSGSGGQSSVGNTCKSSSGRSGTIVASDSGCLLDDAFCEARGDGAYCTGSMPFLCPEGQVRIDWNSCGPDPNGLGGGGAGGEGGEGGAH